VRRRTVPRATCVIPACDGHDKLVRIKLAGTMRATVLDRCNRRHPLPQTELTREAAEGFFGDRFRSLAPGTVIWISPVHVMRFADPCLFPAIALQWQRRFNQISTLTAVARGALRVRASASDSKSPSPMAPLVRRSGAHGPGQRPHPQRASLSTPGRLSPEFGLPMRPPASSDL
jgi:hypothetical protein